MTAVADGRITSGRGIRNDYTRVYGAFRDARAINGKQTHEKNGGAELVDKPRGLASQDYEGRVVFW
jgi:hypothetical protein